MAQGPAFEAKAIENILRRTMEVLRESQTQIYDIAESARAEYNRVRLAISELKNEIGHWIDEVDRLEREFTRTRMRLYQVSKDFDRYSDREKQEVYQRADRVREQLTVAREREKYLRANRDEQERRLVRLSEMVEKAERMVSQVGIALEFLEGNLNEVNQQLEGMQARYQLGQKIIRVQEDERKRVAREIHDGPAQDLANVVLKAEICEKLYETGKTAEALAELRQLKEQVKLSLKEVRKIIHNLRPMALDDLGLIPALKRYLGELETHSGLDIRVLVFGKETRLPSAVEVALFRCVQEAINNTIKHARAKRATVRIEFLPKIINLSIDDDGQGFEMAEIEEKTLTGEHFGLFGMRERIELLGGSLTIQSKPGQGTRISSRIELDDNDKNGW